MLRTKGTRICHSSRPTMLQLRVEHTTMQSTEEPRKRIILVLTQRWWWRTRDLPYLRYSAYERILFGYGDFSRVSSKYRVSLLYLAITSSSDQNSWLISKSINPPNILSSGCRRCISEELMGNKGQSEELWKMLITSVVVEVDSRLGESDVQNVRSDIVVSSIGWMNFSSSSDEHSFHDTFVIINLDTAEGEKTVSRSGLLILDVLPKRDRLSWVNTRMNELDFRPTHSQAS